MAKPSFSKIEELLDETFRKIFIERLAELATIVTLINNPDSNLSPKYVNDIILKFQIELRKLKDHDKKLYERLELSSDEEKSFMRTASEFSVKDWERLKTLKNKIQELKTELFGESAPTEEDEKYIEKQGLNISTKDIISRTTGFPFTNGIFYLDYKLPIMLYFLFSFWS